MTGTIEKSAKLSDVARAAGVSQGTVSNVFNRPGLVREEVREHVHEIARRLGYRGPDPKGRLLRAGKVNAIGIATAEPLTYFFEDPYARAVMAGIAETADAAGAGISLVSAANDEALAWNIQSALVDGFVLFCIEGGERLVRLTRERQLPFIALALGTENDSVATVGVDSLAGGRLAAEHLVGLGHRKFAVVALPVRPGHGESGPITLADVDVAIYSTSRDRVHGYFAVLARHGIDTSTVPIFETQNDEPTVHAALAALFDGGDPPTALLVQSDRAALIAIDWLQARGLDVPGDVSVIGFDGIAEAALSRPGLTTIAQPLLDIGRHAVRAILAGTPQGRQTLPVELVVRASTAPPRR
jgi:DNA-binding LacI/PurR family transcriptional regulator